MANAVQVSCVVFPNQWVNPILIYGLSRFHRDPDQDRL
jgi:hypothetical protein